ncbi:MAG TPA: hypothetical protein VFJ87_01435 [Rhodanobacteraceae bacterium]|nr:hypothetical protein [Rhodanobacteraceae bacterium]
MQYTPNPQSPSSGGVRVLYDYPHAKFKDRGIIDFDYYHPGFREPTVTDALPSLKAKVLSVGGNALIVRNQRIGQHNNRFISISAEVLNVDWSTLGHVQP